MLNIRDQRGDTTESTSEHQQYNILLLRGLEKIRDIAQTTNKRERIMGLRKLRTTKDKSIIRSFIHYCLSKMVTTSIWMATRSEQRAGLLFTIHDEAFAILVMMNSWSVWESIVKGERKRRRGEVGQTLFTNQMKVVNDSTLRLKGWNSEGMHEFNENLTYLVTVRNSEEVINIEKEILNEYKDMDYSTRKRKRNNNDEALLAERVKPFDGYNMLFEQV